MIPEIHADAPTDLAKLRLTTGAALCRQVFNTDEVATLRRFALYAYSVGEAMSGHLAPHEVSQAVADGQIVRGYVSWPQLKGALAFANDDLVKRLDTMADKTRVLAEAAYGSRVRFLDGFAVARRHRASPSPVEITKVPWHRDSTFIGPSGNLDTINFWVPLADVGATAPSLELILGSHQLMEQIREERPSYTNIESDWIDQHLAGFERSTPHCNAGDALFFTDQVVHRTQILADAGVDRINLEFRWSRAQAER
jgi:hypothetical protein